MNNMKYYNDSLAYDFEMFMPKTREETRERDNIVVMPRTAERTKKRRRAAAKSLSSPAAFILAATFILAGLCGNIMMRIKINRSEEHTSELQSP